MPLTIQRDLETDQQFIEVERFRSPTRGTRQFPIGHPVALPDETGVFLAGKIPGKAWKDHNASLRKLITFGAKTSSTVERVMAGQESGDDLDIDQLQIDLEDAFEAAVESMLRINYSDDDVASMMADGLITFDLMESVSAIAGGHRPQIEVREKN